jgi:hypothetical protein
MAVPREFGGLGYSLFHVSQETRRLARYALATALATGAWRIVDRAMDLSGGFGMFKKSEPMDKPQSAICDLQSAINYSR